MNCCILMPKKFGYGMIHFPDLFRRLAFWQENEVYRMRYYKFQIFQACRKLIDPYHSLCPVKVNLSQGIAHQEPRLVFSVGSHRILEVENNAITSINASVDHKFRIIPR